ncbi:MAG TPA: hypothetical protein VII50_00440 [Acidothermaceae bacterium]
MERQVECFATVVKVWKRGSMETRGFRVEIIARRTSTTMYRSAVKSTEAEALTLACKFLKRNPSLVLAPQLGGGSTPPATAILAAMVAS